MPTAQPLALLYDVHGNLPALQAVLEDAATQGAGEHLLGGDYTLFGGWPTETVSALRALGSATWIRGNGERWTVDPTQAPHDPVVQDAIGACATALGPPLTAELAALAEQLVIDETRYCHGSPVSDVRSFLPAPGAGDQELMAGATERRLVFGHTHLPFRRLAGGVELINPGSVGMPFDGDPRAAYALIHPDGAVEHRRVAYDHVASADRVRDAFGGSWAETVATRIERAAFVTP